MTPGWRDLTSARRARWPSVRGAVARPRLEAALASPPVLVVVAPAGYGKTTALAAGVPGGTPRAWLTLDADDADPQVLAAGLALAALGLPGGAGVGALLDAGASPRRAAAKVADLLDASGAQLVLDEAQHLAGPLTGDLLREVLDCGAGRVALLSRVPLPLVDLTRLEAAGEVARLSAADLAFTPQELGALLSAQGVSASAAEVGLAHAATEGWPIAVRFLAQAAAQGRVRLSELADLDGGEAQLSTLFAYLAQEVLGPLEPALRGLLTRGSVFEELTPELLAAVLDEVPDESGAGALLDALAGSGTFLTRSGEQVFRAHPLLRAHLRASLSPGEVAALAGRGAAYFERTGRPRRALAAHLLAGDVARAAALLSAHGEGWLAQGRVTLTQRSLSRLPRAAWTPELHALAGDALRLSSRYEEALAEYAHASPLARALGEVQVALDTVQPERAWGPLEIAGTLAQTESERAHVRRLRAENLLNAGRLEEAVRAEPELEGGARYALRSGDLGRALALAQRAAAGELGGARAAQNHREGLLLASFLHAVLGDPLAAGDAALGGLREGERLESPFVRALALARLGHARQTADDPDAAGAAYEQALTLASGVVPRLRVEPLMGLSALAARRGDLAQARLRRDEALAQTGGDGYMAGLVWLSAALGALHAGTPDPTGLDAAQEAFAGCGDRFGTAAVALARAAATDDPATPGAAQAAADFPFLLGRRSLLAPFPDAARRARLLARLAQAHPPLRAALRPAAQDLGYPDVPDPERTPGFHVHVQVLGRAAVTRPPETRAREWGRAKARDLLLLLAVHPSGVSREAAQEALFPGLDPGVGERNFRVTLHALGQVLEEGGPSGALLERGEWIRLCPGPDLSVDLWEARAWLERPAGTPGRLDALLALPGALADSDLPEVTRAAERHAARLPDALAAEAQAALDAGQPQPAAQAAERALAHDPAHEPAARALMRAGHALGHPAAVRRTYTELSAALAELGLTPTAETEALYGALRPSPSAAARLHPLPEGEG